MRFRVTIVRRAGLADPEGTTTRAALRDLGFEEVEEVHFGRIVDLEIADDDPAAARRGVEEMCRRLLANPVIEDFSVEQL